MEFSADTLKLNLLDLGRTGSKLLTVAGNIDFMCQEVEGADPVTFTTREAHMVSTLVATSGFCAVEKLLLPKSCSERK